MKILRLSFALVVLDQASKLAVKGIALPWLHFPGLMMIGESHDVLGSFLRFTYVENPGMAFGLHFGESAKLFFSLFSLVAGAGVLWYLYTARNGPLLPRLALALILAGALGNFIDRTFYGLMDGSAPLFHGSVVDFIDVDFFQMTIGRFHLDRWPVFNVADSCVTVGVVLFLFSAQPARSTAPAAASASTEYSSTLPEPAPERDPHAS